MDDCNLWNSEFLLLTYKCSYKLVYNPFLTQLFYGFLYFWFNVVSPAVLLCPSYANPHLFCSSRQSTLERCSKCSKPILDRILRAMGKAYHPRCFTCVVCNCCLDGVPFTVDATSQIHCIDDFHRYEGIQAPWCYPWSSLLAKAQEGRRVH